MVRTGARRATPGRAARVGLRRPPGDLALGESWRRRSRPRGATRTGLRSISATSGTSPASRPIRTTRSSSPATSAGAARGTHPTAAHAAGARPPAGRLGRDRQQQEGPVVNRRRWLRHRRRPSPAARTRVAHDPERRLRCPHTWLDQDVGSRCSSSAARSRRSLTSAAPDSTPSRTSLSSVLCTTSGSATSPTTGNPGIGPQAGLSGPRATPDWGGVRRVEQPNRASPATHRSVVAAPAPRRGRRARASRPRRDRYEGARGGPPPAYRSACASAWIAASAVANRQVDAVAAGLLIRTRPPAGEPDGMPVAPRSSGEHDRRVPDPGAVETTTSASTSSEASTTSRVASKARRAAPLAARSSGLPGRPRRAPTRRAWPAARRQLGHPRPAGRRRRRPARRTRRRCR